MYSSEYCDVKYEENYNVVFVKWKKFCKYDDYRNPLEHALEIIKQYKCNYVADTRSGFENIPEDTKWVADYFMPQAALHGCKCIYFIIDRNNSLKEELEGQESDSSDLMQFKYICQLEEVPGKQMKTPILETDRLILRPFKEDDVRDVFECWESDPDVAKYMFWTSHNDIEKTKEWILFELGQIEKQDWYRFAIVLKGTNTLIGTALIYYEEEVECWEIGYNLGKKYWGKGYATEAMKKVIDFACKELKLTQIVGRYAKENPASGNVMNKLGFEFEKEIPYECNNGTVKREGIQCRLLIESET